MGRQHQRGDKSQPLRALWAFPEPPVLPVPPRPVSLPGPRSGEGARLCRAGWNARGIPRDRSHPWEEQRVNPCLWVPSFLGAPGSGAAQGLQPPVQLPAQRSHSSHSQTTFQAGTALSAQIRFSPPSSHQSSGAVPDPRAAGSLAGLPPRR